VTSALVLGAGGTVGMAYHAGVLRALEEVGGFRPNDADLIVGTSAGSMVGAALRSGLTAEDMWLAALDQHPDMELQQPGESPWAQTWAGPSDIARRMVGSAYLLQRSLFRFPVPALPQQLQRLFPGGFFTIADADEVLSRFMPTDWPDRLLWLVTVDVRTGRRVVLGRRQPVRTDLHTAVKASCAIPAFFQPQRVGRRVLVDGGVHSTTNLDLTTKISPDVIIGVVPMAYDPGNPPRGFDLLVRRFAQTRLAREVAQARGAGARVLLLRPSVDDLEAMGRNMMRPEGNEVVAMAAYDSAARQLSSARAQEILDQLREGIAV
jgi:NTE family protein